MNQVQSDLVKSAVTAKTATAIKQSSHLNGTSGKTAIANNININNHINASATTTLNNNNLDSKNKNQTPSSQVNSPNSVIHMTNVSVPQKLLVPNGKSQAPAAPSAPDARAKQVLKEAVDAVVNSFAKHTQGYGRGKCPFNICSFHQAQLIFTLRLTFCTIILIFGLITVIDRSPFVYPPEQQRSERKKKKDKEPTPFGIHRSIGFVPFFCVNGHGSSLKRRIISVDHHSF